MNRNAASANRRKSNKTVYLLILCFIVGPPLLFGAVLVYASQNTGVSLKASEAGDEWAVLIGISDYRGVGENLHGAPVNGAKTINSMLIDTFAWSSSHIRLLLDEEDKSYDDVTKTEIRDAIDWLTMRVGKNDTILFYYSGHGSRSQSGEPEYIAPNRAQSFSEYISDNELANMLSQVESNQMIVIIDACYSGGFAWDGASPGDLAKNGRIILASSREDEYSYAVGSQDGTEWKQRFTSYLVEGLNDGKTLEDAFKQAQEAVSKTYLSVPAQHPQMYDGLNPTRLNLDAIGKMLGIVTLTATAALVLVFVNNRRSAFASQPHFLPSAYVCPVCNTSLAWIPQHQQLYCPNCKKRFN